MARIELRDVAKTYDGTSVVAGVNLVVEDGQFVVLLGPSGCGKTTTLRMIAGLEQISGGELYFDDQLMNHEPPERRGIGMVFQNYALYPHMTVAANLSFGLESRRARGSRRVARRQERERVQQIARLLEIEHVLDHRPRELSGGQRQRVALGRALIREPAVFLLDEPLSNLDANLREKMRMELARLHAALPITTVYVTHDQGEALTLADQLVVMHDGVICQAAPPADVYEHPATTFVAAFLGSPGMNLWPLATRASDRLAADAAVALCDSLADACSAAPGDITVGVRPEHLELAPPASTHPTTVRCCVQAVENLGSHLLVHAHLADTTKAGVIAKLDPAVAVRAGDTIALGAKTRHVHLFDTGTGDRFEPAAWRPRSSIGA
jgi:ABC-type sugar transport system ATPase subunit